MAMSSRALCSTIGSQFIATCSSALHLRNPLFTVQNAYKFSTTVVPFQGRFFHNQGKAFKNDKFFSSANDVVISFDDPGGYEKGIIHTESISGKSFSSNEQLLEALSPKQLGQIAVFVDTLLDWNQRMNLTAISNREAVMERHIGDSLSLLPIIEAACLESGLATCSSLRVVDVGTGAGLPGLVLAIARPAEGSAWQVTLVESLRKRCNFLEHVIGRLDLTNVQVQWDRAENAGRGPLRESCHVAVARAVAELRILAELCMPLLCVKGVFVAPKGPKPQEEIEAAMGAIALLGGTPPKLIEMASTGSGAERTVVVSVKTSVTPSLYPRRAGTPSKKPL